MYEESKSKEKPKKKKGLDDYIHELNVNKTKKKNLED